ncbi:hypothetical protein [Pseudomonas japonica]|uniref:hypothetical protein n=1 Tax=Pseudomonas japonica TaxID=256466 RepID=UPI0015E48C41|nr:hypothetical protein [Pseudomonas japonica]MBA1243740.1 hypothetical protein [Pseudomonas japonica]
MGSLSRNHSRIDRELTRELTWACEQAKSEISGFEWLTHQADYSRLPYRLAVTWIFDSDVNRLAASVGVTNALIQDLTVAAIQQAGIARSDIRLTVALDSEQRCATQHGGDWAARLNARARSGGKHG